MAAMDRDTRLVMTILFVGAVSGTNVYFYSAYGAELPFSNFAHAVLFGFLTVGGIMGLKACFDLAVNDRMELWLLDRKIKIYWEKLFFRIFNSKGSYYSLFAFYSSLYPC